ncbi:MAG: chromosomal replication initiator protein DnaA [Chloroflexi bacterium]|nr:chromosomal replication initiator protein DnaA [Chloroflexota bacterium]
MITETPAVVTNLEQPDVAWRTLLAQLRRELPREQFEKLRNTRGIAWEADQLRVAVPSPQGLEWLQNRLRPLVERKLQLIFGLPQGRVDFVLAPRTGASAAGRLEPKATLPPDDDDALADEAEPRVSQTTQARAAGPWPRVNPLDADPMALNLIPEYTFETFVVGTNNRMAHAASRAVADKPGVYNPLFIYGGVGLGKTHLLHAIGHRALEHGYRVLYVSAEDFVNAFIEAIQTNTVRDFRARYREVDILLVDDIQFIAGKERSESEFFHTFNALYNRGRQLVLSSDRPPKALRLLEERLRSRFEGGLMADIQPPDFETRIAILERKAQRMGVTLPREVAEFIAQHLRSNVRELEGALKRLISYCEVWNQPLTLETARNALADIIPQRRPRPTAEAVLDLVARTYDVSVEDLKGKRRSRRIAYPRQVAMYLLRNEVGLSWPQIGELLGGRDHSTVMHGYRKIEEQIAQDPMLRREIREIQERLNQL